MKIPPIFANQIFAIIIASTILFSCTDQELAQSNRKYLLQNERHIISYTCEEFNLIFNIESIKDTTNEIDGIWPDQDHYILYFDKNNNSELDSGIDFQICPKNSDICYANILAEDSISACMLMDGIIGSSNFKPSDKSNKEHVSFQISIPKSALFEQPIANFNIEIKDANNLLQWHKYPSNSRLFNSTYAIECE